MGNSGSTTAVTTNSNTTTTNGDLIFGAFDNDSGGASTVTAGTGFTIEGSATVLNAQDFTTEDKIQTTAGSIAATETWGTARSNGEAMVAFKPASSAASVTETPNADSTTSGTFVLSGCATNNYACINDYLDPTGTSYLESPNRPATKYFNEKYTSTGTDVGAITSVDVSFYAKDNSTGVSGGMDTLNVSNQLYLSDHATVISNAVSSPALTTSWALYTTRLTMNALDISKVTADDWILRTASVWTAVGANDTTAKVDISSIQMTVHYTAANGTLTQSGYIFENDDQSAAANANSDTAQAAGNTAVTGVQKGERVNLRTQLKDATTTTATNLGLFYDRGDNYWTKVKSSATPITSTGTCADTNFNCTALAGHYGATAEMTSVAVGPNGTPWVSFYDSNNKDLIVANYVGSGGSGCGANGSSAWNCVTVASTGDVGQNSKIAIDGSGNVWVAYWDATNGYIMVAENVAGSGCASSAWTCTEINGATMPSTPDQIGLTISPSGIPFVIWPDTGGGTSIYMARYTGTGGQGCVSVQRGQDATTSLSTAPETTSLPWRSGQTLSRGPFKHLPVVGRRCTTTNTAAGPPAAAVISSPAQPSTPMTTASCRKWLSLPMAAHGSPGTTQQTISSRSRTTSAVAETVRVTRRSTAPTSTTRPRLVHTRPSPSTP